MHDEITKVAYHLYWFSYKGLPEVKRITVLSSILFLFSGMYFNIAQAESGDSYIGIGVGTADTSIGDVPGDVDLDVLLLRLGVWITDNISLEARVGTGIDDDSTGSVDLEVESIGGLYGTYHWNLGKHASVYGIAGRSRASVKFSQGGSSDQDTDNGVSYGAGIKLSILSLEYMRYLDTSDVEADAIGVSLRYTFD